MNALLGADTRRVDIIAELLRGHSEDVQDLRSMAQRAVAELRSSWAGPDFESIARRWEQEAGPRLMDVASALSTMAGALRAQAEGQRQASGNTGGSHVPRALGGSLGGVSPGGGGVASGAGHRKEIKDLDPDDLDLSGHHFAGRTSTYLNGHLVRREESGRIEAGAGVPDSTLSDRVRDNVKVNLAGAEVGDEASLVSLKGGGDNAQLELSAAKVESKAGSSLDVDAHGNLVASAGAAGAAYLGYAAGKVHGGNDFANGTLGGKAYVGAEAKAEASGSIGREGAKAHLGAAAFAGAKAEVDAGATVAGVTAEAGAEISYGIGARADVDAELSATSVGVAVDLGATLGVGAGVKFDVSVNPQEVLANVGHAVDDIGEVAEGVGDGVTSAASHVASLLHW